MNATTKNAAKKNNAKKVIVTFLGATKERINGALANTVTDYGDILSNCYDHTGALVGFMVLVGWTSEDVAKFWSDLENTISGQYKKGF